MKRPSNLVAYFQQLCGIGLDSRIVMPDMLATLQRLISSSGSACFWFDDSGQPGDFYAGSLDLAQRCALAAGLCDLPAVPLALARSSTVTVDWLDAAGAAGRHSGLAQFLLVPGQFTHWLDAWITWQDAAGARVCLLLLLLRRPHERAFTTREKHCFAELAGHLHHLPRLPAGDRIPPCGAVAGGTAMDGTVILRDGVPHWTDRGADELLQRRLCVVPGGTWPEISPLAAACLTLAHAAENADLSETRAEQRVILPGGPCLLRASLLTPCASVCSRAVAISLRWSEARALGVLRQLRDTALSPAQREIAFRLALGQTRSDVRAALAIGTETLKTHLRHIRSRLPHAREREWLALP